MGLTRRPLQVVIFDPNIFPPPVTWHRAQCSIHWQSCCSKTVIRTCTTQFNLLLYGALFRHLQMPFRLPIPYFLSWTAVIVRGSDSAEFEALRVVFFNVRPAYHQPGRAILYYRHWFFLTFFHSSKLFCFFFLTLAKMVWTTHPWCELTFLPSWRDTTT